MLGEIFSSCWDKIGRADEHIQDLKTQLQDWQATHPCSLVQKTDVDGHRHSLIVNVTNKPPMERWALITGDAIHNLRSALDHLVYAVARHESEQTIPPHWTGIQFPIVREPDNYLNEMSRRQINKLSDSVQRAIEKVQPYNRPHAEVPALLVCSQSLTMRTSTGCSM